MKAMESELNILMIFKDEHQRYYPELKATDGDDNLEVFTPKPTCLPRES